MKQYYLKSIGILAFFVFPIIAYSFIMAKAIIIVILGTQWIESIEIFQIFCIYSIIDSIGITTFWIYKATGQTDKMFKWAIYQFIVVTTAIIIGLAWGIKGIALAYTISFIILLWIPGWIICFKIINLKLKELFAIILPPFICTIITAICTYIIKTLVFENASLVYQLLIIFLIWTFLYYLLSQKINNQIILIIKGILKKRINKNNI